MARGKVTKVSDYAKMLGAEGKKRSIKVPAAKSAAAKKKAAAKKMGAEGPKKTFKQTKTNYMTRIAPSQQMGGKDNTSGWWKARKDAIAEGRRIENRKRRGR